MQTKKEWASDRAERRAATRRALVDAARELFAERGYHGTAAEGIECRAGATYHQFGDKRDLFRAVVEETEDGTDELMVEAAPEASRRGSGFWRR